MLALLAAITLTWTAPGDDGRIGTVSSYDVRYSLDSSTVAAWSSATQATGEPAPRPSGITESFQLSLAPGTYWFAVRSEDDAGNQSALSNIIRRTVATTGASGTITYDDFESDYGNFTGGGVNCTRYYGEFAHQGSCAMDLQDNTTTSVMTSTEGHDVSLFTYMEVDFWFMMVQLEAGEDFWLQYSSDGGANWETVAAWRVTPGLQDNNKFYHKVVKLRRNAVKFTSDAKIRFRCDASSEYDDVYIDQVLWRGLNGGSGLDTEIADAWAPESAQMDTDPTLPEAVALDQNFPNPFNPSTSVAFVLPEASDVKLMVFNVLGQEVATLAEGRYPAGRHLVQWDAQGKASGTYFYRLQSGNKVQTRSMVLLK